MSRKKIGVKLIWFCVLLLYSEASLAQNYAKQYADSVRQVITEVRNSSSFDATREMLYRTLFSPSLKVSVGEEFIRQHTLQCNDWAQKSGTIRQKRIMEVYMYFADKTELSDYERIIRLEDLLEYPEIRGVKEGVIVCNYLGNIYTNNHLHDRNLKLITRKYEIFNSYNLGTNSEHAKHKELADVLFKVQNYYGAIEHYRHYLTIIKADKQTEYLQASALNNLGVCYLQIGQMDSAIVQYTLAKKSIEFLLTKQIDKYRSLDYINYFLTIIHANIAEVNMLLGIYDGATTVYLQQLDGGKKFDENHIVLSSYYCLANLYYLQYQPKIAVTYLDSLRINNSKNINVEYALKELDLRGKCYVMMKMVPQANQYFQQKQKLLLTQDSIKRAQNIELASVRLETHLIDNQLMESRQQLNLEQVRKRWLVLSVFLGLLIAGISISYWINEKRLKIKLAEQNNLLSTNLNEKEILLKEVHHRVKNNLHVISGLLGLQSLKMEDSKATEVFNESRQYIMSMSNVHEMLYENQNLASVNLQDYFERLFTALLRPHTQPKIQFNILAEEIGLTIDHILILGILSTELVTNSLKHAFNQTPGSINLSITQKENNVCHFYYSDSGSGFAPKNMPSDRVSLGLKLIEMMSDQIGGDLQIEAKEGFALYLTFSTLPIES